MLGLILLLLLEGTVQGNRIVPEAWESLFEREGITIFRQDIDGLAAFKATGEIALSPAQIVATMKDLEHSQDWTPKLKNRRLLELNPDGLSLAAYSHNSVPWPASDRDTVMRSELSLHQDKTGIVVNSYSITHEDAPVVAGIVRMEIQHCLFELYPRSDHRTYIQLEVLMDPKGSIPRFFVNYVQKSWPIKFLKALEKQGMKHPLDEDPAALKLLQSVAKASPALSK